MTTTTYRFDEVIESKERLREIVGEPMAGPANKTLHAIDEMCAGFIAHSPFLLIATANASGWMDVSPKGDPPGFVRVLDENTLVIPDRPGNHRADTFTNLLQNDRVGLIFLVPGRQDTLRVSGRARIVRDETLANQMAVRGKAPALLVVVDVEEAFFHCAKCIIRSNLWEAGAWPDVADMASFAEAMAVHSKLGLTPEQYAERLVVNYRDGLY